MKVAIYIDQGVTQLVLTPESDWEKAVISAVQDGSSSVTALRGSFYETRGGWVREGTGNDSLILRMNLRTKDDHGIQIPDTIT